MIPFLLVEISIILAGLIIILGHIGVADKILIGTFFIIFFAVIKYLSSFFKNEKNS